MVAGPLAGTGTADTGSTPVARPGGATATLTGLTVADRAVLRIDGRRQELPAGLFAMTVDGGGTLKTYGVDLHSPAQENAAYAETSWSQTSLGANPAAGKIRWILQHSYPQVDDLTALAKAAGSGPLTRETAAAGTQVAIWRHSDRARVDALDPAAERLADWLGKQARYVPEPPPSLSLESPVVAGRTGTRLGPVTVRTGAARVTVAGPADTTSGVRVTGADGRPVTSAVNGGRLWFDVPAAAAPGTASLTVQVTTTVPVGRAFAGVTKSQTQILAGSSESTTTATATATWAKKGPIPALSARKNCAAGGVDITAVNQGDAAFAFELLGTEHYVPPGAVRTVPVPLAEDQAYELTLTGTDGFVKAFDGLLDCATTGSTLAATARKDQDRDPGAAGGTPAGPLTAGTVPMGGGEDLAATGASGATPMIAGVALGMVLLGGTALFLLRRKEQAAAEEGPYAEE
ncbi:thioester domain-containing protein [Streptomyces sp. LP05-1]|uniref:Thioester domain-containing protein n=1 Tax=Streptomyces pyxinae TaxID=2970734 RepID=A0ABT2CPM1_9ACTN|nr:thioester domain-containing protein [Streptomyces sp. LP05-1]MCS0638596.1 thioester domain-containing protein [Streptomyces sp. LP05-1]